MASKEKRDNIPKCACRRCLHLGTNHLEKHNDYRVDKATDIDCARRRNYPGHRRAAVECCFGCNEQGASSMQFHNRGTFIKFSGPTSGRTVDPAESVLRSDSKIGSCSGCLLERNHEGKSRAFDLINKSSVEKPHDKYFRSVNVWLGVLVKPVFARTRRCPCSTVKRATNSPDSELSSSGYNCCDGKRHSVERPFSFVNSAFFLPQKVGQKKNFKPSITPSKVSHNLVGVIRYFGN